MRARTSCAGGRRGRGGAAGRTFPVPCGSVIMPRTRWSLRLGSTLRWMATSRVSSNLRGGAVAWMCAIFSAMCSSCASRLLSASSDCAGTSGRRRAAIARRTSDGAASHRRGPRWQSRALGHGGAPWYLTADHAVSAAFASLGWSQADPSASPWTASVAAARRQPSRRCHAGASPIPLQL